MLTKHDILLWQTLKEDLEGTQGDLDQVHETGEELLSLIGEPDKPEVEKNMDDLDTTLTTLKSQWAKREKLLDTAMRKATCFQEDLMVGLSYGNWYFYSLK